MRCNWRILKPSATALKLEPRTHATTNPGSPDPAIDDGLMEIRRSETPTRFHVWCPGGPIDSVRAKVDCSRSRRESFVRHTMSSAPATTEPTGSGAISDDLTRCGRRESCIATDGVYCMPLSALEMMLPSLLTVSFPLSQRSNVVRHPPGTWARFIATVKSSHSQQGHFEFGTLVMRVVGETNQIVRLSVECGLDKLAAQDLSFVISRAHIPKGQDLPA